MGNGLPIIGVGICAECGSSASLLKTHICTLCRAKQIEPGQEWHAKDGSRRVVRITGRDLDERLFAVRTLRSASPKRQHIGRTITMATLLRKYSLRKPS